MKNPRPQAVPKTEPEISHRVLLEPEEVQDLLRKLLVVLDSTTRSREALEAFYAIQARLQVPAPAALQSTYDPAHTEGDEQIPIARWVLDEVWGAYNALGDLAEMLDKSGNQAGRLVRSVHAQLQALESNLPWLIVRGEQPAPEGPAEETAPAEEPEPEPPFADNVLNACKRLRHQTDALEDLVSGGVRVLEEVVSPDDIGQAAIFLEGFFKQGISNLNGMIEELTDGARDQKGGAQ